MRKNKGTYERSHGLPYASPGSSLILNTFFDEPNDDRFRAEKIEILLPTKDRAPRRPYGDGVLCMSTGRRAEGGMRVGGVCTGTGPWGRLQVAQSGSQAGR